MTQFSYVIPSIPTGVLTALMATGAFAQSAQIPAPPQSRPIIIENATLHPTPGETIDGRTYLVFDKGIIRSLGRGEAPRIENARHINADGLHIYPGLISTDTTLGLTETGSVQVTQDSREIGDFTPEVRAAVAVNPDTDLIPVTRANGILLGLTFPQGGVVSGQCSIIRFDGWTWEDMAIDAEAGLVVNWPRTEPIRSRSRRVRTNPVDQIKRARENIEKLEHFFDDAETYLRAKAADPSLETDLRYEATRDYLAGAKPIFIRANSAGQIDSAVAWAHERDLNIVIVGGREADKAIPILKKHDVPVIIDGVHRLPSRRHDAYDAPFTLPKKLYEAGVRFSIATGGEAAHERNLNYQAATAAAYGLPRHEALNAVTLSAARILGIDDRYGSLERGKSATLIITTGDPLEITTDIMDAFIDGRRIDLGNRHKRLHRKYLEKYRQLGLIE